MDFGSLVFPAFFFGMLALCTIALKIRSKQISYECELVFELHPEFLKHVTPAPGDVAYFFFHLSASRRNALGTVSSRTSGGANMAWAMGDRLHAQKILGVVKALDGTYLYIETFGYEGKGVWHVVDSNGEVHGIGRVNSLINISFKSHDQVHFTDAEIGSANAILRGFRRI